MNIGKILLVSAVLVSIIATAAADDYIIRDSGGNPLFTVNSTGEKQIQNGNLFLNGNSIVDNEGALTLEGGNVEVPSGNLNLGGNSLRNVDVIRSDDNSYNQLWFNSNGPVVRVESEGGGSAISAIEARNGGNVQVPNGNLNMEGNEIQNVGALELGWQNLTDYPAGCETDEAVQVVGDTLSCTALNPGGTVETGGGSKGQVAFFTDSENVTGSDNFYWNNSQVELGLGTNSPTAALDVNGETNLRNTLYMNGNDISNPGLVDGVHLDSTGNAIGIDGSNRYYVPSGAIDASEITSNAITAGGSELDSSVAGNQIALNSGTLDVQDRWVDENGDTITNQLTFDVAGNDFFKLQDASGGSNSAPYTLRFDTPRNFRIWSNDSGTLLRAKHNGNVAIESGNLQLGSNSLTTTGNVNGVDIDNPGNGIIIDGSNRYAISSGAVGSGELSENSVTNTELANSDSFTMSGATIQGDAQVQGDLDVWGTIQNTNVTNLNVDGSILPPSGYDDTFDIGSNSRRWRQGHFSGNVNIDDGLDVTGGTVDVPAGTIQNGELANSAITVNANSGLVGGGTPSLGGSVGVSHEDTSGISNVDNSGGTIIQDLNFDGYGHVTGQTSYNLDNRYYTESESDSNFVDESGDTMTDALKISNEGRALAVGNGNHAEHYIRFRDSASFGATLGYDPNGGDNGALRVQSGDGKNMVFAVNNGTFGQGQTALNIDQQANLEVSNSIENFFGSNCATGEVVESVNADGTYNCQSITGAADDTYVNEGGDTMTGPLNMDGNNINGAGTVDASTFEINGDDITGLFVDETGDSMSGSLNMQGNHIDNVNFLDFNSEGNIRTDGTNAVNIDSNQNVDVVNGNLRVGGGDFWTTSSATSNNGLRIQSSVSRDQYSIPSSFDNTVVLSNEQGSTNQAIAMGDAGPNEGNPVFSVRVTGSGSNPTSGSESWQKNFDVMGNGNVDIPNGNLRVNGQITEIGTKDSNNIGDDGDLFFDTDDRIAFKDSGSTYMEVGGNPNTGAITIDTSGNIDTSGQLSVGSTQCSTGSYIDGDGTCTDVTDETQNVYVEEAGDTMSGELDMNYNRIDRVGELNVSTSTSQIAHFSDTGVEISQPLSLESSGPLSVANGVDLTGSSTNTIESYSTMYLTTSSGSPSDIVLDPTGDVGIDANASVTGDLDLQGGALLNANLEAGSVAEGEIAQNTLDDSEIQTGGVGSDSIASGAVGTSEVASNSVTNTELANSDSFTVNGLTSNSNVNVGDNSVSFSSTYVTEESDDDMLLQGRDQDQQLRLTDGGSLVYREYHDSENVFEVDSRSSTDAAVRIGEQGGNVPLDMNSNIIDNLQNPNDANDAANKDYVDTQVSNAQSDATQNLNQVLSQGNDAGSQAITSIGSGNIDIDGSGAGNIQMNGEEIRGGSITQSQNLVAGSYSTGSSSVDGGDVWVENDVEVGGDVVGSGADVAENIQNESEMEPGTVVSISGNMSVNKTTGKHDTEVAGVVSTDPAMIMAKDRGGVPVAMTGTVPVKVTMENGKVMPGDMLTTSSTPGKAMKCNDMDRCEGSIIGKAMEPATKPGKVTMLISMG